MRCSPWAIWNTSLISVLTGLTLVVCFGWVRAGLPSGSPVSRPNVRPGSMAPGPGIAVAQPGGPVAQPGGPVAGPVRGGPGPEPPPLPDTLDGDLLLVVIDTRFFRDRATAWEGQLNEVREKYNMRLLGEA